jgi:hypothetical protein
MTKKIFAKRDYKRYPNYKTWSKWRRGENAELETALQQLITEWLANSLRTSRMSRIESSPTQNESSEQRNR